jgi:hypothetical protein
MTAALRLMQVDAGVSGEVNLYCKNHRTVIPAQAGIQPIGFAPSERHQFFYPAWLYSGILLLIHRWIPACAGMTMVVI